MLAKRKRDTKTPTNIETVTQREKGDKSTKCGQTDKGNERIETNNQVKIRGCLKGVILFRKKKEKKKRERKQDVDQTCATKKHCGFGEERVFERRRERERVVNSNSSEKDHPNSWL